MNFHLGTRQHSAVSAETGHFGRPLPLSLMTHAPRAPSFFSVRFRATASTMWTDEELVEKMTRGDQAALGQLYERYAADIGRLTVSLLKDAALAADTVQDVFLEAWHRADQFDRTRGTVRAWLIVKARSRCLDRLRARTNKKEVSLTDTGRGKIGSVEQSIDAMHLPEALMHVSPEERDILLLGYFEGLTCEEMSQRLGIPVGTVKSRTRSAMEKLRNFWETQS